MGLLRFVMIQQPEICAFGKYFVRIITKIFLKTKIINLYDPKLCLIDYFVPYFLFEVRVALCSYFLMRKSIKSISVMTLKFVKIPRHVRRAFYVYFYIIYYCLSHGA